MKNLKAILFLLLGFSGTLAYSQSTDVQLTNQINTYIRNAAPVLRAQHANVEQAIVDSKQPILSAYDVAGTNTYTVTVSSAITSYLANQQFTMRFANANTGGGPFTLNINTLGAKTLKKTGGTDLIAGDIKAGQDYIIVVDGTNIQLVGGAGSGGGGTVTTVGALSPLFTTANPTTAPAFSLISQSQNVGFFSPNGSSGVASFRALVVGDLPASVIMPFPDNAALVKNNSDNTKLLIFDASLVTTATTRTWKFPDVNGTVARNDAAQSFTGVQTFISSPILPTPSPGDNSTKGATTEYVDLLTLPPFNTVSAGYVLASGDATKFLRGDNSFQTVITALTNGSGTTANGTAVDLGGALTLTPTFTGAFHVTFGNKDANNFAVVINPSITNVSSQAGSLTLSPTVTAQTNTSSPTYGGYAVTYGNGITFAANNAKAAHTYQGFSISKSTFTGLVLYGNYYNPGFSGSGTLTHYAQVWTSGLIGIGTATPTATVHISTLGTTAAGSAPLKIPTGGTLMTTPEDGAFETNASHLYYTISSTRYQLDQQSGGWPFTGTGTFTGAVIIDQTATAGNTLKFESDNLGVTPVDGKGLWLYNSTAAAPGAQQISGSIVQEGQGWATTPVASQSVKVRYDWIPIQGAANPTARWELSASINGGAYANLLTASTATGLGVGINTPGLTNGTQFNAVRGHFFSATTNTSVMIDGATAPTILFNDQSRAANSRLWGVGSNASNFQIQTLTDGGSANTKLSMDRNANTIFTQTAQSVTNTFITLTQAVHTGGSPVLMLFTGGAHTNLAATSEATDINFNLARAVQFATGAIATQRAIRIQAPTYGFVGASIITDAVTLDISGDPIAGTNATITNGWGLRNAGRTQLGGATGVNFNGNVVSIGGALLSGVGVLTLYDGALPNATAGLFSLNSILGDPRITNANGVGYSVGGALVDFITDTNNGTTVETDLYTFTTLASTLSTNGDKLFAKYSGKFNDATATCQLRVYFGGTLIGDTGALTVSSTALGWEVNVIVIRTGATTVRTSVTAATPGATILDYSQETDVTGLTLSNTNILKITGTAAGASGGSGDITSKLGSVTFIPSAP